MPALANAGYYAVLERKDGEVVLYAPYTELKDALGGGRQKNPNAGKNLFSFAKPDPAETGNNDTAFAEMEAVRRAFTRPDGSVLATMDSARQWLETKFIHDQTPVFDAVRRVSGNDPLPDRLNVEAAAKNVHGKIRARQEEVNKVYVDTIVNILRAPGMSKEGCDDYARALPAIDRNRMIHAGSVVVGGGGVAGGRGDGVN